MALRRLGFFKYIIFEQRYLAYDSMKGSRLSHGDSSNSLGGKCVSEFLFRPLFIFYDMLKICPIIFLTFFLFYSIKKLTMA